MIIPRSLRLLLEDDGTRREGLLLVVLVYASSSIEGALLVRIGRGVFVFTPKRFEVDALRPEILIYRLAIFEGRCGEYDLVLQRPHRRSRISSILNRR